MSEPELKDLCQKYRFPKKGWQYLILLLYAPFGLAIAVIRACIGIQAILAVLILPDRSIARSVSLRMIFGVLGIVVKQENSSSRDKSVNIIIANKVTRLDFLVAHLTTGSITWDLPASIAWILHTKYMGDVSRKKPDINQLRRHVDTSLAPLFLQPEESCTNGKVGLLKFAPWTAKITNTVQPATIRVSRPSFLDISCDVLGASFISELFWFLFTPTTFFELTYLPVIHKEDTETEEEFTEKVEKSISEFLGVHITKYTAADKTEYEKRYLIELNQPVLITSSGQSSLPCSELQRMISQVKEVLPHVPVSAILQDLNKTHSVDVTISNILEGNVQYIPVQQQTQRPDPAPSNNAEAKSQPVLQSISQGQGKMISFMERKAKLIADARRKYIEKHGLVDAWAE